jgi:large subunit ribosomal protein L10
MIKIGKAYRDKMVQTIKDGVSKNNVVVVVNFKKISSSDLSSLRKTLRSKKAKMCASRNSLVQVAFKGTEYTSLTDGLDGQTAVIFSSADPAEVAKALVEFSKKNESFVFCGGVLDKSLLTKDDIKRISSLPSREVLIAQLLGTLQSPMTRLARALNGKTTELILILKQLSEKRGGN